LNAYVILAVAVAVAVAVAIGAGGRAGFSACEAVVKGTGMERGDSDFQKGVCLCGAEEVVVEGAVEGRGSHSGVVKGLVVG